MIIARSAFINAQYLGIVPSTPTLATARRCDGFGEAVSSPHVPSGRFTFMESTAPNTASNDVLPEQTLEMTHADDNSTLHIYLKKTLEFSI